MSLSKTDIITEINEHYDQSHDYNVYLNFALNKYRFENYNSIKNQEINPNDYIISDSNLRNTITNKLNQNNIKKDEFNQILEKLTLDQLSYIGV